MIRVKKEAARKPINEDRVFKDSEFLEMLDELKTWIHNAKDVVLFCQTKPIDIIMRQSDGFDFLIVSHGIRVLHNNSGVSFKLESSSRMKSANFDKEKSTWSITTTDTTIEIIGK
jgi:hypothetical protein